MDLWPSLQRSSSSASGACRTSGGKTNGSTSLIPVHGDAWASPTILHRAASTSSSATASRRPSTSIFSSSTPPPPPATQLRRRKGGTPGHVRSQTSDVMHDAHPLSQPPSPAASSPPSLARITHTVSCTDSLADVALRYSISVAALRRANGLWASDSIHLRAALVIPDGREPVPKTTHARARTSLDRDPGRSVEHAPAHASTSTATDVATSFSLLLPRLRVSLDGEAPSESDAEHKLLPLSLSAHRRKSRSQLSMTTTNKQPSPIRGMVLPRAGDNIRFLSMSGRGGTQVKGSAFTHLAEHPEVAPRLGKIHFLDHTSGRKLERAMKGLTRARPGFAIVTGETEDESGAPFTVWRDGKQVYQFELY
ncbi:hypothetical protein AURDEDRAFT_121428 [Auricularia subglabra TFB-10046 SS5]|nr:hypothetical protein AURDEDRAFT_121428 [Auricularia subglabra TFB-10046 SS5]